MKIKQVEELVGITRKNIRFYEEQGLLSPGRAENGYREYNEADIIRLKQIKLLRTLTLPIEEIREVLQGKTSLEISLAKHLHELERQRESIDQMEKFSRQLIESGVSIDHLDVDSCLSDIKQLEKEGTRFMDVKKTDIHRKKTIGALLGAGIMIVLMIFMIGIFIWGEMVDPLPMGLFVVIVAIPIVVIIGVVAVLIERVKEIKGGEEDEASKY